MGYGFLVQNEKIIKFGLFNKKNNNLKKMLLLNGKKDISRAMQLCKVDMSEISSMYTKSEN